MSVINFAHYTNYIPGTASRSIDVVECCSREHNTRSYHVTLRGGSHNEIIREERFECSSYCDDLKEMKVQARAARELGDRWARELGF